MYIRYNHRVYGLLRICHVPVLDKIAYGNAHSTLWHHLDLCVDHKMEMIETGFYCNIFSHICAQPQYHSEHDIPFLCNYVYLPIYYFFLINHPIFTCRSREVFLKLTGQTNIICKSSSVHIHLCVIHFCTHKLQSWYELEEQHFVNGVESIYYISTMSWCTNYTVNNNRKWLWQHSHQV